MKEKLSNNLITNQRYSDDSCGNNDTNSPIEPRNSGSPKFPMEPVRNRKENVFAGSMDVKIDQRFLDEHDR